MMELNGWGQHESPFHPGELQVQAKLGLQAKVDRQGRRFIRPYLTEEHQVFLRNLTYITVGTVDRQGAPWASIVVGEPGFIHAPDAHTLQLTAPLLFSDPLKRNLQVGTDIGLLGIELETRRRNRVNGVIQQIDGDQITIAVTQTFGNCPQYIQSRFVTETRTSPPPHVEAITTFAAAERALIQAADTFFIATAYQDASAGKSSGVDVSHRGGKPGFIRIDDANTLTIPDFSGNKHFNTIGNLVLNPKAGLLFIDFDQGDLLYLTGTIEIIWAGETVKAFAGAERLMRFRLEAGKRVHNSLPLVWSAPEMSPFLQKTGSWAI